MVIVPYRRLILCLSWHRLAGATTVGCTITGLPLLLTALIALIAAFPKSAAQAQGSVPADVDKHLHEVAQELPPDSPLRGEILTGVHGSGVRDAWMDEMTRMGIKEVNVSVDITFAHNGHPKHLMVSRVQYFSQYDGASPILDAPKLEAIRASGLENQVKTVALERAGHGFWVDVPRPRPKPFVGGVDIELFDDEWLPVWPVLYFARNSSIGP